MAPPPLDSPHAPASCGSPSSEREEKDDGTSRERHDIDERNAVDTGSRFIEVNTSTWARGGRLPGGPPASSAGHHPRDGNDDHNSTLIPLDRFAGGAASCRPL